MLALTHRLFEAGRDDCDLHFVLHLLVEHRAEDDVRVFVGGALDDGRSLVDLGQPQRAGAGNVDEDAARAVDGSGFEQRRGNGACAASLARFSPRAVAVPITA